MSKVSILIPTREEPYLRRTVKGLLDNAAGEVEVIITLDGPQKVNLHDDPRIVILKHDRPKGRRQATNTAVRAATGKYIMKIDAHCTVGEGYDEILKADCEDNWIVAPKRFNLDVNNWKVMAPRPKPVEANYLIYPYLNPYRPKLTCRPWPGRSEARKEMLIDEDMSFMGACWFMHKSHWERLGEMEDEGYGTFVNEPEEICLKTQLGPWEGKVMRNKKTWYAHWSKYADKFWVNNAPGRIGWLEENEWHRGFAFGADYWFHNRWPGQVHSFEWLIEKWWPLPAWPQDWRSDERSRRLEYGARYEGRTW